MPLKILFLTHVFRPAIGGIETSSEFLANALVEAGHQVHLMTMTDSKTTDQLPYLVIRKPSVITAIQQHQWADIVFENNPCLRLGYPKLLFGKPSVIVLHTWINRLGSGLDVVYRMKRFWLSQAQTVVTISRAVQQRCWPAAVIIGNTYNDKLFTQYCRPRNNNFVFVGRLVSDKGVELAIRAFGEMVFTNPVAELADARLTIIGDGDEYDQLNDIINRLPDPGRIRLIGSLMGQALVEELNQHTFQFIPSIWEEPFGIVALEGIACGLIPIVSDGGGLPDAVGQAGVTFKRGQLDSLVAVTVDLLRSPDQQQRCREAAPRQLAAHSSQVIAKQFVDLLAQINP